MDSYPFGGHHANAVGEAVRKVLGATGKRATMPKDAPGSVQGTELEAVLAWAKAFEGAHHADEHEHEHEHGHADHDNDHHH